MKLSSLSFSLIFSVFFSYSQTIESDYIQVLGIVQDAGYPHIGCEKDCCKVVSPGDYFVSCLGLVDKTNNKRYLFDATPDIHNQAKIISKFLLQFDKNLKTSCFIIFDLIFKSFKVDDMCFTH